MLRRVGNAPKFAIPYQTDAPFGKIRIDLIPPAGAQKNGKLPAIEFLCHGQQVVAFGRHPDTKRDYERLGGASPATVRRENLPYIAEADAVSLVKELVDLLVSEFGFTRKTGSQRERPEASPLPPDNPYSAYGASAHGADSDADPEDVKAALPFISNDLRDTWLAVGMALHSTGWDCARELWDDWSSSSPKFDAADPDKTWESYGRGYKGSKRKITIASLFHLAQEGGWERYGRDSDPVQLNGGADPAGGATGHTTGGAARGARFKQAAARIERICASDIKLKAVTWLWPDRFAVGKIGIIAGLPDEGKGQIVQYMAARVTTGGLAGERGPGAARQRRLHASGR
jgi:putative DNA primase/helicase